MYEALQIVPGAFFLMARFKPNYLEPAVCLAAALFGGIALLRIFGIAVDGTANAYHLAALAFEIPTTAFASFAASRLARKKGQVTSVMARARKES
jgi:ABC-type uncharacterized transport system permease subunit